jgi:hypothetical protein
MLLVGMMRRSGAGLEKTLAKGEEMLIARTRKLPQETVVILVEKNVSIFHDDEIISARMLASVMLAVKKC